ncbi:hypothetical protein M0R45_021552 [Rubus argutus]|uniref:Uncharacterized protein n=1 Tax=Rubus argutus TaxID=59490 RepID=A0AAW1XE13_RUBAR
MDPYSNSGDEGHGLVNWFAGFARRCEIGKLLAALDVVMVRSSPGQRHLGSGFKMVVIDDGCLKRWAIGHNMFDAVRRHFVVLRIESRWQIVIPN